MRLRHKTGSGISIEPFGNAHEARITASSQVQHRSVLRVERPGWLMIFREAIRAASGVK
jgi:hypothetical protein